MLRTSPRALVLLGLALTAPLVGCGEEPDVVIYCALDQVDSEPILREFEERTGLKVLAEFDVEAHKTVGLVRRIREERDRTRCDVFWNNEIAHTVSLARDGLLAEYDSPSAAGIPENFRDPERRWTGFAARAGSSSSTRTWPTRPRSPACGTSSTRSGRATAAWPGP